MQGLEPTLFVRKPDPIGNRTRGCSEPRRPKFVGTRACRYFFTPFQYVPAGKYLTNCGWAVAM